MLSIIAALAVGILLGLLGGGGGIVTVPTLVYVVGLSHKEAVPNCLVILSLVTAFSAIEEWRQGRIRIRGTIVFALLGTLGSFAGARLNVHFIHERLLPILFVIVVISAAFIMIKKALSSKSIEALPSRTTWPGLLALWTVGFFAGLLGGIVGVGGGFLMVPALNLIAGYPMTIAVGTNLLIIALNAMVGALGYRGAIPFHPQIIATFVILGIIGSLVGSRLRAQISDKTLKLGFGIFLLVMSVVIAVDHLFV